MTANIVFSELMGSGAVGRFHRQIGQHIDLNDKNSNMFKGLGLHIYNSSCVANDRVINDLGKAVKQNREICKTERKLILMAIDESRELMFQDRTVFINYSDNPLN